jgi:putative CRISPR-associated protein (TIGR02619 family)
MPQPLLLLSTCGTSLLTNLLRQRNDFGLSVPDLIRLANVRTIDHIPAEQRDRLDSFLRYGRERIDNLNAEEAVQASAEINGITKLDGALGENSLHYLLATDTYLGQQTAGLVERWLHRQGQRVNIFRIPGLTTESTEAFMSGAKELLRFTDETIGGFSGSHRIVFNLTGGFKSLLGLMTTLGTFYADEIVYVFERSPDLIRIPKLPIQLDDELIERHAATLLRMAHGECCPASEVGDLPPALLDTIGPNAYGLSVWGELVWRKFSDRILSDRLLDLPHLHYESSFRQDFERLEQPDRVQLQRTLARVSGLLAENGGSREALLGHRAGGIKYEQFTGKHDRYGHFRFGRGLRVSCEPASAKLLLRHCGQHDYVNDRP